MAYSEGFLKGKFWIQEYEHFHTCCKFASCFCFSVSSLEILSFFCGGRGEESVPLHEGVFFPALIFPRAVCLFPDIALPS